MVGNYMRSQLCGRPHGHGRRRATSITTALCRWRREALCRSARPAGAPAPQRAEYQGGEERLVSDHEQAHIVLGFEGRAYNSDGFYAAQVLASVLGGGMSSRLFQEVREKRGLCYSVYSFHWAFADSGVFGVAAATGEDEVSELVPVVLDELLRAAETVTDEEVTRVRNQIRAGLLMSLESPSARAGQLARSRSSGAVPFPWQRRWSGSTASPRSASAMWPSRFSPIPSRPWPVSQPQ